MAQVPLWTPSAPLNSYFNQDSGTDETDPHLSTDGNGTWVTVWKNAYGVYVARSTDMGNTWSAAATLEASFDNSEERNAKVVFAGNSTWVALWTDRIANFEGGPSTSTLMVSRSTDGLQWSSAAPVTQEEGYEPFYLHDAESDGAGTILASSGRQLVRSTDYGFSWSTAAALEVPVYHIFSAGLAYADSKWIHAVSSAADNSFSVTLQASTSPDGGSTWSNYKTVNTATIIGDMAAKGDTIVIAGRNNHHLPSLHFVTSGDGGATWATSGAKDAIGGLKGSEFSLAVDSASKWTLVIDRMSVYQPIFNHDIIAMHSSTPAGTWSNFETLVREPEMHEANPSLAIDRSGAMVIVYQAETSSDQPGPLPPEFNIKSVSSINSGANWSVPKFVNPNALTDLPNLNDQSVEMAYGENGVIVAVWDGGPAMFARSDDYGQTWSNTAPIPGLSDAAIHYRGNGNWFAWENNKFAMSHDNGFTWTQPDTFYGYAAASSNGAHGTMVKAHTANHDPALYGLARLDRNAQYWDEPTLMTDKPVHIAHSGGGNWFSLIYGLTSNAYQQQPAGAYVSSDDGRTWTKVSSTRQVPSHAHMASNHNGVVTATWLVFDNTDGHKTFVYVSRTLDNGMSWSEPSLLINDSTMLSNAPRGTSVGDNQWAVVWSMVDPNQPEFSERLYTATSRDNGATWSSPRRVTNEADLITGIGEVNPSIVGADGKLVVAWEMNKPYSVTTAYGYDFDLLYSFGLMDPPPTAARDWQLFE